MGTQERVDTAATQTALLDVLIRGVETISDQQAAARAAGENDNNGAFCLLVYWAAEK
jgi:hypothetical protein